MRKHILIHNLSQTVSAVICKYNIYMKVVIKALRERGSLSQVLSPYYSALAPSYFWGTVVRVFIFYSGRESHLSKTSFSASVETHRDNTDITTHRDNHPEKTLRMVSFTEIVLTLPVNPAGCCKAIRRGFEFVPIGTDVN